jgi:hypothetical protein
MFLKCCPFRELPFVFSPPNLLGQESLRREEFFDVIAVDQKGNTVMGEVTHVLQFWNGLQEN